jgi:hypothetical protein
MNREIAHHRVERKARRVKQTQSTCHAILFFSYAEVLPLELSGEQDKTPRLRQMDSAEAVKNARLTEIKHCGNSNFERTGPSTDL